MNPIESQAGKRKRSLSDDAPPPPPSNAPIAHSNVTPVNYLVKAKNDRLKLIEGDSETFSDILALIDEYEAALHRHESIAANLGAKLVGPLLVKSVEKLFEGSIKILQARNGTDGQVNITWLDIVDYAGTKPNSFVLNDSSGAGRVYQFWLKNYLVQISEDDYRLILSGAPERMIPNQPVPEDDVAELGTMEILEQRLTVMIRKADLVALRARQLNYQLKGRKAMIQDRRAAQQSHSAMSGGQGPDSRQSSTPFQAVNNRSSSGTGNGEAPSFHRDLLRQFQSDDNKKPTPTPPPKAKPHHRAIPGSDSPNTPSQQQHQQGGAPPRHKPHSHASHATLNELVGGQYRPAMIAKMEKLARGAAIWPCCDRCRRLKMECTKYLTACAGCTRKHAKCSWNDVTEEEVAYLEDGGDGGLGGGAGAEGGAGEGEEREGGDGGGNGNGDRGREGEGEGNGGVDAANRGGDSLEAVAAGGLNANLDPGLRGGGNVEMGERGR